MNKELDTIIETLNKKDNIANITTSESEETILTEEEKALIKTYQPEKVLIVYGTLAPGRQNHYVVENIKGQWRSGIIRGKLKDAGWGANLGYKAFHPTSKEEQEEIKAFVLFSGELMANWKMLDEFEGPGYKRIIAKYELDNGETGVGYVYANNEEY